MELYKNSYRVESKRLKDWDYFTPWWYYVTICTKDMKCWFGEVKSKVMSLNKLGKYVDQLWIEIPRLYPAVELDYYISMPCHIHGIIILNTLETKHASSLQRKAPSPGNIIGSFKSAATKWIRKNYYKSFSWQRRFYDHIIRNENDLYRIRNYIQNNPLKWEMDEYYKG